MLFNYFALFFALFFAILPNWIHGVFGELTTAEQIVFHILSGINGLEGSDNSISISFALYVVLLPLCLVIATAHIFKKFRLNNSNVDKRNFHTKYLFFYLIKSKIFCVLMLVFSLAYCSKSLHLKSYLSSFRGPDTFSELYVNPNNLNLDSPGNQKNLILIYFESLEHRLEDEKIFGVNLIKEISTLPGQNFVNTGGAPGSGWSIAGMIASQCSIPLKVSMGTPIYAAASYLPGVTCLGDVLADHGYKQYFLVGPDLKFTGMDKYYGSHGYQHMFGRDQWKEKGVDESRFVGWGGGLHDDALLDEAKKIVIENAASGRPYNLTVITTDTHAPDGFPSPNCSSKEKGDGFKGAFQCSSRVVASFIKDLESRNLLKNTVVVIMGDHHFMANPHYVHLYFPPPRNIYFKVYDPKERRAPGRKLVTHYDLAPTILDSLGILNDGNGKFGLGVSVYSDMSDKEFSIFSDKFWDPGIMNHSIAYDKFWLPKNSKGPKNQP